jgi:hypothetical protein
MCFFAFTSGICNLVGFADYINSKLSCALNAAIIVFSAVASINLVGVVALERYLLIVREKGLFNRTYYMIILGLQLINLFSVTICGVFGGFSINSTSVYCIYNTTTWAGVVGTIILALSISSSIFMIYLGYISIMIKRRKLTLQNQNIFPFKAEKIKKDANSTILKSGLIIIVSTITTLPYCILLFISLINPKFLTPLVMTLCTVLSMLNMAINTIIVLRLRTDLWNGLKELFFIKPNDNDIENESIDDYQLAVIS